MYQKELMSDAPINAGKHVMSNIECARSQCYTKDLVSDWPLMFCVMMWHHFVGFHIILDGLTNGLLILQLPNCCEII